MVDQIVHIMGNLNPHLKNVEDFKHLLWDHLHIMADFSLDVESPYPLPEKEVLFAKPAPFPYPEKNTRFKHYGKNISSMIEKASEMEEGDKKTAYTKCIANYMKIVHNNWNSETVTDETIINDLEIISKGNLHLGDEVTLKVLAKYRGGNYALSDVMKNIVGDRNTILVRHDTNVIYYAERVRIEK